MARLVAAYGSGRDLSALLQTMFTDRSFGSAANSLVIGPVEWLVGVVRALAVPVSDDNAASDGIAAKKLLAVLRRLGQLPFYPPDVSGWPSGQAWMSTAAAGTRLQVAAQLARTADLSALTETGARTGSTPSATSSGSGAGPTAPSPP